MENSTWKSWFIPGFLLGLFVYLIYLNVRFNLGTREKDQQLSSLREYVDSLNRHQINDWTNRLDRTNQRLKTDQARGDSALLVIIGQYDTKKTQALQTRYDQWLRQYQSTIK
ncbi:hypothetical protein CLV58_109240 [Spirosoma oryzae]|uniref:Uncharacterized protein n=1 Tax=Spirosoma oryzae TaxID=1469603 RepID=A0A2T0SYS4_9BACT|nr:hypothetical protein [Spirosoma oryzae]PRY38513.1 hypothetical protein CLV58_109240 [Spirosoma oryzae]